MEPWWRSIHSYAATGESIKYWLKGRIIPATHILFKIFVVNCRYLTNTSFYSDTKRFPVNFYFKTEAIFMIRIEL